MSAAARVRHTVNGGKDSYPHPRGSGGGALDQSLEDRYQRVLAENHQLKTQRNELQDKVKDLTTKFRRLVRDLKLGVDVDALMAAPSPRGATPGDGDASAKLATFEKMPVGEKASVAMMEALTKERDFFREQARQLQFSAAAAASSVQGAGSTIEERIRGHENQAVQFFDKQRLDQALKEVARLQSLLQQEMNQRMQLQQQAGAVPQTQLGHQHNAATAAHRDDEIRGLRMQLQQQQQELLQAKGNIEHLTRERDTIQMQLRLAKEVQGDTPYGAGGVVLDSMSLLELQQDIQNRVAQITVLSNRLTYAQNQVGTFKQECERLVNELRLMHGQMAEVKKQLFEQEHEKASLALRCERLAEVELSLHHKQDELLKTEQQLLRMVEKMQSVGRDTEMSVRREVATRLAEAEQSRDEAERLRRTKEQALYDIEQEVTDLRRKSNLLQEALEQAKKELAKESEERKELAARNAILSGVSGDLGEDIHKAVALATMRQRLQTHGGAGKDSSGLHPGDGILNLWEGLEWNEGWEAAKLRETVAASALDLELADTRVGQLTSQLHEYSSALKDISLERDTLLDENSTLRRRISGVQTSLAKRQLARYRRQMAVNAPHAGVLTIRFKSLKWTALETEADTTTNSDNGVNSSSGSGVYFLTLDHVLPSYETLVSSVFFRDLSENTLDVVFEFRDVHLDEATLASLRNATFDVQLHRCGSDNTSTIVGYAEWPAARLMSSDGGYIFDAVLDLVAPGSGACVARCVMDVDSENLMLPVLLGAPLSSVMLDPERVNVLLYKLRSVVAIRIQVFQVGDIPAATTGPYLFYTCAMVDGVAPIVDTTVEPLVGARALMQRINAAAAATTAGAPSAPSAGTASTLPFDHDPKDHPIVLDRRNIHSIAEGVMVFVLFDRTATNVQEHVAMLQVPLRPLLESPQATIIVKDQMQPTCSIELGISWVHGVQ